MTVLLAMPSMLRRTKYSRELLPQEDPEESRNGVKVVFLDAMKAQHHLVFDCAPWGLSFYKDDPTKVQDFRVGSYAREKGVKIGWRLTQVGDKYFPVASKTNDVQSMLADAYRGLSVWPL